MCGAHAGDSKWSVRKDLVECKLADMELTLERRVLGVVMVLAVFDLVACGETGEREQWARGFRYDGCDGRRWRDQWR